MEVVFVLLPLSLVFVGIAVGLFVWAVKRGQFDDLETPAVRILFEDEPASAPRPEGDAESGDVVAGGNEEARDSGAETAGVDEGRAGGNAPATERERQE